MHIQIVAEAEQEQFRNLSGNAKSIAGRAKLLVEALAKADPHETMLYAEAIAVRPLDVVGNQGQLAIIETPIGEGRATLGYGVEDGQLVGHLIFSRLRFDQHDVATWEPCFTVFIPVRDALYAKTPEGRFVVSLQKRFDQEFSDSLFDLMMAIIASMIR